MSKLKQFVYEDNNRKIYYLAERECDNYYDVHDHILHREDGPAMIEYEDGNIWYEDYFINNRYHREDGPAYIEYYKDGRIRYEAYYINGKRHREDGPARICYDEDGNINLKYYWLDGKGYKKEEYDREIKKRNTKIGGELYD